MQAEKLQLIKLLLETTDQSIVKHMKAFFETRPGAGTWFEELPDEVRVSVERGLEQSSRGEGTPHSQMKGKYQKWLSK